MAIVQFIDEGGQAAGLMLDSSDISLAYGVSLTQVQSAKDNVEPDRDLVVIDTGEDYALLKLPSFTAHSVTRFGEPIRFRYQDATGRSGEVSGTIAAIIDNATAADIDFYQRQQNAPAGAQVYLQAPGFFTNGLIHPQPVTEADVGRLPPHPFQNLAVVRIEDQNFLTFLPAYVDPLADGTALDVIQITPDGPQQHAATLVRFIPTAGDPFVVGGEGNELSVNGESFEGTIRRLDAQDSATALAEMRANQNQLPFHDDFLVASGADRAFYQVTVPSGFSYNFNKKKNADHHITVEYSSHNMAGEAARARLTGTIVACDDIGDAQKYVLAEDVKIDIVNPDGSRTGIPLAYQEEINNLLAHDNPFKKGHSLKRYNYDTKKKALQNKLERLGLNASVSCEWVEPGKSIRVQASVTTPPTLFQTNVVFEEATTPAAWIEQNITDEIRAQIENICGDELLLPITNKKLDRTMRRLKAVSRKDERWEIVEAGMWRQQNGVMQFDIVVRPKPHDISVTIDDAGAAESWDFASLGIEHEGRIKPGQLARVKKKFYEALSDQYEAEGKILVVDRQVKGLNGVERLVTEPYLPEFKQVGDKLVLEATDAAGQPLKIRTAPAPTRVELDCPLKPKDQRIENFFTKGENGKAAVNYSSSSIYYGVAALTDWYHDKGYPLRGGRLFYEVGADGVLRVSGDLYKIAGDIEIVADTAIDENTKKKITNEFRQKDGDYFNRKSFDRSLAEVGRRYHFKTLALPYEQFDHENGTVALKVILLHKEPKDILNMLTGQVGYGGEADELGVMATLGHEISLGNVNGPGTGNMLSSKASYSFGPNEGGISTNLSTPADATHGRHYIGASGSYDPNYVSKLGASYAYLRPIGQSNWSTGPAMKADYLAGSPDIDGTGALYFGPSWMARYDDGNGLTGEVAAGPRIGTNGAVFAELSAGINKRWNLSDDETIYAEAYAKAGLLAGAIPAAALYSSVPMVMHGAYMQSPVAAYGILGAAIMKELNIFGEEFLDVGLGASAGFAGPVWSVGGGLRLKFKLGSFTVAMTIGPALVNGVPSPVQFSFG